MTRIINAETRIPYLILLIVFIISIYPFFYMISTSLMTAGEASNQYLFPKKLMLKIIMKFGHLIDSNVIHLIV